MIANYEHFPLIIYYLNGVKSKFDNEIWVIHDTVNGTSRYSLDVNNVEGEALLYDKEEYIKYISTLTFIEKLKIQWRRKLIT